MKHGTGSKVFSLLVSVLLAATLSACGSQFSNPSPNPTATPQAVIFEVENMLPDDGDMGIMEDAKIEVTFNVAINPKTLTKTSFSISEKGGGMAIRGRIEYDEKTLTATFTPEKNLEYGMHYTGLLTRGVTDAKGVKLARTEWEFMVRAFPLTKEIHKSPADKATGIALNTGIRVDFPTRLKPSTVPGALVLKDPNGAVIPGELKYTEMPEQSGIAESIYFQPKTDLLANTTYTVTLSKSITTLTGNPNEPEKPLAQDEVWSYTTASTRTSTLKVGEVLSDWIGRADVDAANNVFSVANIEGIDQGNQLNAITVVKSDNQGNVLWKKTIGNKGSFWGYGIVVDGDSNPIIIGDGRGTFGADPSLGGDDIILSKLNGSDGTLLWTRQIGSAADDYVFDVAVDAANVIYVSGLTTGAFDGKTSAGNADAFIVSLGPNGADRWLTQLGSDADDVGNTIGVNSTSNSVFLVGNTRGALAGQKNNGGSDVFVSRLSTADGTIAATTLFGGATDDFAYDVVVSNAGVYINSHSMMMNTPDRVGEALVLALDSAGTVLLWQKTFNFSDNTELQGIDVDATGNLFVAGWFNNRMEDTRRSFVLKLDTTAQGAVLWNQPIPVVGDTDMNHEYPAYAHTSALVLDSNGNIFVAGTILNGGLIDGYVSYGRDDGFVLKMNPAGVVQ